jgi:hypothetical protein
VALDFRFYLFSWILHKTTQVPVSPSKSCSGWTLSRYMLKNYFDNKVPQK